MGKIVVLVIGSLSIFLSSCNSQQKKVDELEMKVIELKSEISTLNSNLVNEMSINRGLQENLEGCRNRTKTLEDALKKCTDSWEFERRRPAIRF